MRYSTQSMEQEMQIKQLIGSYHDFFADLSARLNNVGISLTGLPISHLLYRVTTLPEYTQLRDQLRPFCSEFVETQFNDRAISILILKEPLILSDEFSVSTLELPAPRPAQMYPSGLESVGIIIGNSLNEFNRHYKQVLSGIKEHGEHNKPSFITFENNKTVKFYAMSLKEMVLRQGWSIEKLAD